jgi:hypothetical protein
MASKAGDNEAAGMARAGHPVIVHQGPNLGSRLRQTAERPIVD